VRLTGLCFSWCVCAASSLLTPAVANACATCCMQSSEEALHRQWLLGSSILHNNMLADTGVIVALYFDTALLIL
jgi:hypothetical protein